MLAVARNQKRGDRHDDGRGEHPHRDPLRAGEPSRAQGRRNQVQRADAAAGRDGDRELARATRLLGDRGQPSLGARRVRRARDRRAQWGEGVRDRLGVVTGDPDRVARPPAGDGEASASLSGELRLVRRRHVAAQDERVAVQEQQVRGVAAPVDPRDALAADRLDEREEIVGRHRDGDGSELRLLGEPDGRLHYAPVRRGDEDALRLARRLSRLAVRRQREEVERRIVRRKGQVPVELEPDHLPHLADNRREVDRFDGHRRAGQAEGNAPRGEPPRVQLRAERLGRVLGLDDERIHAGLLDGGPAEPVAQEDDGEPQWSESQRCSSEIHPCETHPPKICDVTSENLPPNPVVRARFAGSARAGPLEDLDRGRGRVRRLLDDGGEPGVDAPADDALRLDPEGLCRDADAADA